MRSATQAERAAVRLLADVGGDREWWIWNSRTGVGHLRVALTESETGGMTCEPVIADAGPSGPGRLRTRR